MQAQIPLYPYHDITNSTNNLIMFWINSDLSPVPVNVGFTGCT